MVHPVESPGRKDAAHVLEWRLDAPRPAMSTHTTIGKLAKAAGVPVSTVRYYEQRGLLKPDARTASSYRLYGSASMKRLRFIRAAQASGFTLEDIGKLFEIQGGALDPCTDVRHLLERRLKRVDEQLTELTRVRGILSESIEWCLSPHEAGCCQVIEELDSVANSSEGPWRGSTEVCAPSKPDEIARTLLAGLRGSLQNARVYVAAKRLLARGTPLSPRELAEVLEEPLDDILETLSRTPGIERDWEGNVLGWGLTLKPTPHRFDVEGKELFTWCAFDTLFFPALLGRTVTIRSTCPRSGDEIRLTVRPDGIEAVHPAEAVVSIVLPDAAATRSDVRGAFCNQVHYFRNEEAASEWLEAHSGGILLPVEEAFQVGRTLSSQVLAEAGES